MVDEAPISEWKYAVSDDSESEDDHDLPLQKLELAPKRKLLVLCIGGFLLHRVYTGRMAYVVRGVTPDVVYGKFLVYKRPFCTDFMKFCFERFEVGLWSGAKELNIDGLLRNITGDNSGMLSFVWGQSDCKMSPFSTLDNADRRIFLKDLKDLWERKEFKGKYSASNTLLIDDEPYTCLLNPPNTAYFPRPYKKHDSRDTVLGPDGELRRLLDEVANADDVPSFIKDHPFGQPAITSSHSHWDHYAKVVRYFNNRNMRGQRAESSSKWQKVHLNACDDKHATC